MDPRLLIIETSGRIGRVAMAGGSTILALRSLEEARRHARDLAPAVAELLTQTGWQASEVTAVIVSRGPGSYTGLRVGLMSAKTFAFATGCALVGVETFAAIALQAPQETQRLAVIADAQQGKVYVQPFARKGALFEIEAPLAIRPFEDMLANLTPETWLSGPGLDRFRERVPPARMVVEASRWDAGPQSILQIGLARYLAGERDDVWSLEPIYLRPSAAEEKTNV